MIGVPGETPETIAESFALLDNYAIPKTVMLGQIVRHEND
jgi:hypothetical protein